MNLPLEVEAIMPRIDGINKNLRRLKSLGRLPFSQFSQGDPFDLAQHHLRLALEGIFHIGSHVLSRIPGGRAVEYKEIAVKLGDLGIVKKQFAVGKLVKMAGLRNILVHHYADIDPKRFYSVVKHNLTDIEFFLKEIKKVIKNPKKFKLKFE
ncbi:DUF86 domain-containing protein [Candidatus Uhrbacteria bacterium]|nr:DUF86 domain-containing protein [Candidatus Uhrbacteria bacterium]